MRNIIDEGDPTKAKDSDKVWFSKLSRAELPAQEGTVLSNIANACFADQRSFWGMSSGECHVQINVQM